MKISRDWLQTFFTSPLPPAKDLGHALTFHAFEIEDIVDDILDVKVTPNRGHDALSYRGIAKEIAAILKIPFVDIKQTLEMTELQKRTDSVSVTITEPEQCSRYMAGYIRGVKVGPSPEWLVNRLGCMGQQSINNVVDATNFVMFNIGQPLHAFDAGKLKDVNGAYAIEVRKARKDESMVALDKKEYVLSESNLVIGDKNSETVIGIAGVKGGIASGIEETTKDLILESANFNGVSVRKTAQSLKLRTDASSRFEQVISPELAAFGMRAAAELILNLAGGEIMGFVDEYPRQQEKRIVTVDGAHINRLLGGALSSSEIEDALMRLMLPFTHKGDTYLVDVPFERLDITIAEDLIEEVGRIIGYEKIVASELSEFAKQLEINQRFAAAERVREELVAGGYSEVYTSIFSDLGERAVLNKVGGERPYLRTTLADGLTDALKRNILNKDLLGIKEIKLFEIGTVWKAGKEIQVVGKVGEKEKAQEVPLEEYVADDVSEYAPMPFSTTERYESFSKYPYIVRDVALWVPKGTDSGAVLAIIRSSAGDFLQRSELFDRFEKGDKLSLAFRLVFQSFDKTLTDDDANHRMESVYKALKAEGYEIR